MERCIYLKQSKIDLTYKSEEHIFPAGIGGIQKLPRGYVSDQFNTDIFSKIELDFMRNSIISLPRMFQGPGKRGNLSEKSATKSNITLMESTLPSEKAIHFGYIKLGKPYLIPQILFQESGLGRISLNPEDGEYSMQLNVFYDALNSFSGSYYEFFDDKFDEHELLLGYFNKKWYLGSRKKIQRNKLIDFVKEVSEQRPDANLEPEKNQAQQFVKQKIGFDINNYFRTCAKISFNFLASLKGQEFILHDRFDPLRNWIVGGGNNEFAFLIDRKTEGELFHNLSFPKESHKIIISKIPGNRLVANVSFYGSNFETGIYLCDDFYESFELEGLICDWLQRREIYLNDLILYLTRYDY
ncbi:hypothetical protein YSY43_17870 [Paenibacillus sp. YSY-4.3]